MLIVPSLEGEPLFDVSHRVATTWQLGRKGTDNGALLLIAIKDRKIRIEVGYGLEGVLTDARSAQIIRNEIVPRFRAGDFPGGITAGVQAILKTIEGTYQRSRTSLDVPAIRRRVRQHRLRGDPGSGHRSLAVAHASRAGASRRGGPLVSRCTMGDPALIAGGVSLALVSLLSALGQGAGTRAGGEVEARLMGPGSARSMVGGDPAGSADRSEGPDSFSGGGGDFGGGGASGDW